MGARSASSQKGVTVTSRLRSFALILIVAFVSCGASFLSLSEVRRSSFAEELPLPTVNIVNEEDLRRLADAVNGGTTLLTTSGDVVAAEQVAFATYVQLASITFDARPEIPVFPGIGTQQHPFRGTFRTNVTNHTIIINTNTQQSTGSTWGLFTYLGDGARLENIALTGTAANLYADVLGSLVGVSNGTVTLINCQNRMNVHGGQKTGGLVGHVRSGIANITNSFSGSFRMSGFRHIGGVVGYVGDVGSSALVNLRGTAFAGSVELNTEANLEAAHRGVVTGGIGGNSEVGIVYQGTTPTVATFAASSQQPLAAITIAGEISTGSQFNAINFAVRSSAGGANITNFSTGAGKYNGATVGTTNISQSHSNIGRETVNVNPNQYINRAPSDSNVHVSFTPFENNFIATETVFNSPDMVLPSIEHTNVRSRATGSGTIVMFFRMSLNTYVWRNVTISVNLRLATIETMDTTKYDIDEPIEVRLTNHFTTGEGYPYEGEQAYAFLVHRISGGKIVEVSVFSKDELEEYVMMSAGTYRIRVTITVPSNPVVAPVVAFFTMFVYNSDGQAFDDETGGGGGIPDFVWDIVYYVLPPVGIVVLLAVIVLVIVKKRKKRVA
jgi:hypothetical protein